MEHRQFPYAEDPLSLQLQSNTNPYPNPREEQSAI